MAGARHTKGVNIVDLVRTLHHLRKEGHLPALPPEEARYLDERILVSAWYPFDDFLALLRRIHAAQGGSDLAAEEMGRYAAQAALTGVHKIFLRDGDPTATVRSLGAIWKGQFDFGASRIEVRDGQTINVLEGYPDMSRLHSLVTLGWIREAVRLAGGDPTGVRILAAPHSGGERLEIALGVHG